MNVHSSLSLIRGERMSRYLRLLPLGALALVTACGSQPVQQEPPPRKVGVVALKEEAVALTTELPGRVVAAETSEVRPQINGIIKRRLFAEGSMVRAGQVLYEIEDASYRAALGIAQGNLARAQASIDATRLQAERYRSLIGMNAVSKQELDNAEAAARQARADTAAQRSNVAAARINVDFTRIRAPISGRIGRSAFTPGALVQAGQAEPLATILRTDEVYVDVTQSAAQILNLREAMAAGGLSRGGQESLRVKLLLPNGKTLSGRGAPAIFRSGGRSADRQRDAARDLPQCRRRAPAGHVRAGADRRRGAAERHPGAAARHHPRSARSRDRAGGRCE